MRPGKPQKPQPTQITPEMSAIPEMVGWRRGLIAASPRTRSLESFWFSQGCVRRGGLHPGLFSLPSYGRHGMLGAPVRSFAAYAIFRIFLAFPGLRPPRHPCDEDLSLGTPGLRTSPWAIFVPSLREAWRAGRACGRLRGLRDLRTCLKTRYMNA